MSSTGKKVLFACLGLVVFILVCVLGLASTYISNHNYGNRAEQQIVAEYERSQNVLSRVSTTVMDVSKVNERYADDLKEIVQLTMSGRYGEEGSQATMQWLQEQNVQLDSSMYQEINTVIRSGRQDFQNAQDRVIDVKRSYETRLGNFWSGTMLSIAGYPKIDLDDYDIILDESTVEKFESGVDDGFL